MESKRQVRFASYVVSLVHAVVSGGTGLRWMLSNRENPSMLWRIMPFMMGYFLSDMWCTRSLWSEHPVDLIHHFTACGLLSSWMRCRPGLLPPLLVAECAMSTELSTIFLNIAWFLKEAGYGSSIATRISMILFALVFIGTRIVWGTAVTYKVHIHHFQLLLKSGHLLYALYGVMLMQCKCSGCFEYQSLLAGRHHASGVVQVPACKV